MEAAAQKLEHARVEHEWGRELAAVQLERGSSSVMRGNVAIEAQMVET